MSYLCNPIDWTVPIITNNSYSVLFLSLLKNDKIMNKISVNTVKPEANPINSIVENNYKKSENNVLTDTRYKPINKNKLNNDSSSSNLNGNSSNSSNSSSNSSNSSNSKGGVKKGILSQESQQKLNELKKIDKFMETTIFT